MKEILRRRRNGKSFLITRMWKCFTISAFTILKNMDRKEKIPSAKPIRNAFLLVTCHTSEGKLRGEALVGVRVLNSYVYS